MWDANAEEWWWMVLDITGQTRHEMRHVIYFAGFHYFVSLLFVT